MPCRIALFKEKFMGEFLTSSTIVDLGLPASTGLNPKLPHEPRVSANLPAIPEDVPGMNRVVADLIDLAAIVDQNPDRVAARDRMRERLVRDEGKRGVHFAPIEFDPVIMEN